MYWELTEFKGYFQGVSPTRLQGKGISDVFGPGYDTGSYAENFAVSDFNELESYGSYSRILDLGATAEDRVSSVFLWRPPSGGEYLFLTYDSSPYYLERSSTLTPVLPTEYAWGRSKAADPTRYSMYEPYGNALYFCDGVNPPLRISLNRYGFPRGQVMGVEEFRPLDMLALERKPRPALSSLRGGIYTYAITVESAWGESPATNFRFNSLSSLGSILTEIEQGATGFCPTILLNWAAISEEALFLNIYRTSLNSSTFQFLARIPRGKTSYVDCKRDAELGGPLSIDRGAPTKFRILREWNDQMFGVGGFGRYNRLAVSKLYYPDVWPLLNEIDTGPIGDDNITQLWVINGSLYVWTERQTFRLTGFTPADFSLELVNSYLGCASPKSMVSYDGGVVCRTNKGIHYFDGQSYSELSGPVSKLLRREAQGAVPYRYSAGATSGNYYIYSYNETGHGAVNSGLLPNRTLICNLSTGSWGVRTDASFFTSAQFSQDQSIIVDSNIGGNGHSVYLLSPDFPQRDSAYTEPVWTFRALDFEMPHTEKTLMKVHVWYEALKECPATCQITRESAQIEDESDYTETNAVVFTETSTQAPSNAKTADTSTPVPEGVATWGASWDSSTATTVMKVRRHTFTFTVMTSKSFAMVLKFTKVIGELTVQRIAFEFEPLSTDADDYIRTPTSSYVG